jgi:hypothetical protein
VPSDRAHADAHLGDVDGDGMSELIKFMGMVILAAAAIGALSWGVVLLNDRAEICGENRTAQVASKQPWIDARRAFAFCGK